MLRILDVVCELEGFALPPPLPHPTLSPARVQVRFSLYPVQTFFLLSREKTCFPLFFLVVPPLFCCWCQPEYLEAKAKWEATLGKLEELTTHTTELVRAREVVYDQLVGASLSAYAASEQAAASSARCVATTTFVFSSTFTNTTRVVMLGMYAYVFPPTPQPGALQVFAMCVHVFYPPL